MVELALSADNSVSAVAQRLEINQNQLSRWITEYRRGDPWATVAGATWLPIVLNEADEQEVDGDKPDAGVVVGESSPKLLDTELDPNACLLYFWDLRKTGDRPRFPVPTN